MSTEPEDDPRRRRKDPFDDLFRGFGIDPTQFENLFEDMQRALSKMMSEAGGFEPGKPYMHGFSFKIGPDGKPRIEQFGNTPRKTPGKKAVTLSEERVPPSDVIESKTDVAVTLEMPGVDKNDIDINVTDRRIEIKVDTDKRKYHKLLDLPASVKPETTKATYKNGVLDIVVQKKAPDRTRDGYKVKVQ